MANLSFGSPIKFDIPAQPAADALVTFSKQSGVDVLFSSDDLRKVRSPAVVGNYEPDAAIALLLKDTGFDAIRDGGKFVVHPAVGAIKGMLMGEGGRALAAVLVMIRETAQSTATDRYGEYVFPKVAAGTYVLVATAPGYQTMHITDVVVRTGRELTLGREELRKAHEGVLKLEPFVVKADTVEQLEKFEVTGSKQKPFETANVDLPRTINDAQPYYIFSSADIDRSGATNVDSFLKTRLTMNTVFKSLSQAGPNGGPTAASSGSSINLRGLGTNETLILVNGRRQSGINISESGYSGQTDLNGIPLAAIERIEILPSSAGAIYGGSAMGGVINVILKKSYVGGEARMTYENTWDSDSAIKTYGLTVGTSLEGGRSNLMLVGQYSTSSPLLIQDRESFIRSYLERLVPANPSATPPTTPFLGATPNISSGSANPLVLKGNISLNSPYTFIPTGVSPTTTTADLNQGLLSNAGKYNTNLAPTYQPNGLKFPIGSNPTSKSLMAKFRRQMTSKLELFVEATTQSNHSSGIFANATNTFRVSQANVYNPFTTAVRVSVPLNFYPAIPNQTSSTSRGLTLGGIVQLPHEWRVEADYSWSENKFSASFPGLDVLAFNTAVSNGTLNPFVDAVQYPLAFERYQGRVSYYYPSSLSDFAVRAGGNLYFLPWRLQPSVAIALEHRKEGYGEGRTVFSDYATAGTNSTSIYFGKTQSTDSGYAELQVPFVDRVNARPLVQELSLQVAARLERYRVETGSLGKTIPANGSAVTFLDPVDASGQPYTGSASFHSANPTVAVKYKPAADFTVRASLGDGFLPPTYTQLRPNAVPDIGLTQITDPKTGQSYGIATISGGNPNLTPQTSRSFNAGLVWEPSQRALNGLRVNLEYYEIRQENGIQSLGAQQIINSGDLFGRRITRDGATGLISQVDQSALNVFKYETNGWDASLSYRLNTARMGAFTFWLTGTRIEHEKRQLAADAALVDFAGFPIPGGETKLKMSGSLVWEKGAWVVGWSLSHIGSYNDSTVAGVPAAVVIPAQSYHDLFVSYTTRKEGARNGSASKWLPAATTVQLGVKNVFNTYPPFDPNAGTYFYSYYGDPRLRTYSVSLKLAF